MIGYFVLGTLAAYGALCALWAMLGWLLPGMKGWVLVRLGPAVPEELTRARWLRSLGLLDVPLVIAADGPVQAYPGTEICSRADLLPRLERERNRFDGTGDGDPAGRSQRCGVSEL